MKRTKIDANQFELEDTVVAIKRVSKTVKGGRTMRFSALVVVGDKTATLVLVWEKLLRFRKQSARAKSSCQKPDGGSVRREQ